VVAALALALLFAAGWAAGRWDLERSAGVGPPLPRWFPTGVRLLIVLALSVVLTALVLQVTPREGRLLGPALLEQEMEPSPAR
jgi:hypothetical protein